MSNPHTQHQQAQSAGKADYQKAAAAGLTTLDRWGDGIDHHPESERLVAFLAEHDFADYNDYFCWKVGGDGDNGETLMFQMDAYFEQRDREAGMITATPAHGVGEQLMTVPMAANAIFNKLNAAISQLSAAHPAAVPLVLAKEQADLICAGAENAAARAGAIWALLAGSELDQPVALLVAEATALASSLFATARSQS